MNSFNKLNTIQTTTNTALCIGLDPDLQKIPEFYPRNIDGIISFCIDIINSTKNLTSAYKINFAFFELWGHKGFEAIEKLLEIIPNNIFTIADAKRCDIGNSAKFYAKSIFENFGFDAITINPLMGKDSIDPFLSYTNKITYALSLTSNSGADDFLKQNLASQKPLYLHIIEKLAEWYSIENIGFVVGATQSDHLMEIRKVIPKHNLLVPGVGAQQGDLNKVEKQTLFPALINVSRDILYNDEKENYLQEVVNKASLYNNLFAIEENFSR